MDIYIAANSCLYHKYFKRYELLNMMTLNKKSIL